MVRKWFQRKQKWQSYFSSGDLDLIKTAIQEQEKATSGEIRVKIIDGCDVGLNGNIYQQALREFEREGLSKTRDKTGVLILVVLDVRRFQVLADEGIYTKIPQVSWDMVATYMQLGFQTGKFVDGVLLGVELVGNTLSRFFPRKIDDTNELPNDVIVGGGS